MNDKLLLKHNVELFTISLMVNIAKEKGLNTVTTQSPLFRMSYDELSNIAGEFASSNNYSFVGTDYGDRRNAPHPSGIYSDKTLTLEWD